jgi:hypothetical protein
LQAAALKVELLGTSESMACVDAFVYIIMIQDMYNQDTALLAKLCTLVTQYVPAEDPISSRWQWLPVNNDGVCR